jgi:hypothetical protein
MLGESLELVGLLTVKVTWNALPLTEERALELVEDHSDDG